MPVKWQNFTEMELYLAVYILCDIYMWAAISIDVDLGRLTHYKRHLCQIVYKFGHQENKQVDDSEGGYFCSPLECFNYLFLADVLFRWLLFYTMLMTLCVFGFLGSLRAP